MPRNQFQRMVFAFFKQMHFIQPFVRAVFKVLFAKDIKVRATEKNIQRPKDEVEAIADIFRRMDEIQNNLEHERRQRKKLATQTDELTEGMVQNGSLLKFWIDIMNTNCVM